MSKKTVKTISNDFCAPLLRKTLPHVLGWLIVLVSLSFFTATYDSAHVKLTLLQIGSFLLFTLWACLKITQHKNPFTRIHLLFLMPLLVYMGWQTLSFLGFAYKLEAAEEFIRLWMYAGISILIACEFTQKDVALITKYIVGTAWISFLYGLVQVAAIRWPWVDFLPWHGFFAHRVFASHANPNFFGAFIVFTSAIMGVEFLRTRKKSLLMLLAIGLIDLFFTESKGAWLAYGLTGVFITFTYTNLFVKVKKHLTKINIAAVACLLVACGAVGIYSAKRFQSVSFRTYTWLSAFEMVKDSPILGTGPGSFKLVYPAYRRPQIFYIENAHNNETQHAENEYLEQAATGGIVGLAMFLWLMGFLFTCAFKNIRQTDSAGAKSAAAKERRFYLLGYAAALAGLLIHAFVDISLHFASSGLLFAVFIGSLLALCLDNPPADDTPLQPITHPYGLLAFRILLCAATLGTLIYMWIEFIRMLHHLSVTAFGEGVLFALALVTFAGCSLASGVLYIRISWKTTRMWVCALLIFSLPIYVLFFNFLTANHYYSLGVALVTRMQQPYAAIPAFTDAIKRNPFLAEYRHYRANVFATTLDLSKRFSTALGDTSAPRTDYDRALADFEFVQAHNPNHALLQQDMAQLYYALAMRHLSQAQTDPNQAFLYQQLAAENFEQSQIFLRKALQLDPVNINTYLMLINIALLRHDVDAAQQWVDSYQQGPSGVTEKEFLLRHRNNAQMKAIEAHVARLRSALS